MSWFSSASDSHTLLVFCFFVQGRTGVMICSYLLHDKLFDNTKDALQFYGEARTQNAKVSWCSWVSGEQWRITSPPLPSPPRV